MCTKRCFWYCKNNNQIINKYCEIILKELTISGSRWCSMNAENSTKRSLCVAIALPSHGGTLGGWISEDTAVEGGLRPVDPLLG